MSILEATQLFKAFGGVQACNDVSFSVEPNQIVGLIGPNGSGKTTVLNLVSGFHAPDYGEIWFDGRNLVGSAAHRISRAGVSRTWQDPRIIPGSNVYENIELGSLAQKGRAAQVYVDSLLEQFGLEEHAYEAVGSLPYGKQKLVALARTLAASPRVLLLDEPLAGLSEREIELVTDYLGRYRNEGSILIVDHAFATIMNTCDRAIVLDSGRKIVEGEPAEVREHEAVAEVYFGSGVRERGNRRADTQGQVGEERLRVQNLCAGYGGKRVVWNMEIAAKNGECVALLGVNGAGKSTCFRAMMGVLPRQEGTVTVDGRVAAAEPAANARAGFHLVPEGARAFESLSVRENLELGGFVLHDWAKLTERIAWVLTVFPKLRERLDERAGDLSGGERQMLAIARALIVVPRVLLLDEPFLGLAPIMIEEVSSQLDRIRGETGCPIVVAEQRVSATLEIADRVLVVSHGRVRKTVDDTDAADAERRVTEALLYS